MELTFLINDFTPPGFYNCFFTFSYNYFIPSGFSRHLRKNNS
jgi:hypothetical protein